MTRGQQNGFLPPENEAAPKRSLNPRYILIGTLNSKISTIKTGPRARMARLSIGHPTFGLLLRFYGPSQLENVKHFLMLLPFGQSHIATRGTTAGTAGT
jgi:hypothetical protein